MNSKHSYQHAHTNIWHRYNWTAIVTWLIVLFIASWLGVQVLRWLF
ncbi:hypothetical protein [Spirosoma sp. KUDC1026]|nr:hypothetical protein [Spirosoma sp. KUDC1026]QKZ13221.1 hypothetical protein HU175_11485 [Spirosoma sp. KUDC1026]